MIKKSLFEDELIEGMQKHLALDDADKKINKLDHAVDCLNSAASIFEDVNLTVQSDKIINLLSKIAQHNRPKDPRKIPDSHTKQLTPQKMVDNLKHHGTVFNMADDGTTEIDVADESDEDTFEEENS